MIWLIEIHDDIVNFYSRVSTETYYTWYGSITTNIPIVALDTVFMIKAGAGAQKEMRVFNYMLTHDTE